LEISYLMLGLLHPWLLHLEQLAGLFSPQQVMPKAYPKFALIANCIFAPLLLHERFRKVRINLSLLSTHLLTSLQRELFGIVIAIIGAVTVVFASNSSDTRLGPDELLEAIKQIPFLIYTCIYVVAASFLMFLSEKPAGRRYVFVDIGLCALFGMFSRMRQVFAQQCF
jgi:magnesium transporter